MRDADKVAILSAFMSGQTVVVEGRLRLLDVVTMVAVMNLAAARPFGRSAGSSSLPITLSAATLRKPASQ